MFNSNSSAGLPVSWHWDFGDFSTSSVKNPTHFYLFPFTYNVCLTITTALGCYDTFCDSVTIQNTIGIAESMQLADLKIYPNPFSNEIIIESEILNNNLTTITLTNLMGQQVLRYSTEHSNLVKLNLSEINSGVYIMHITNGEKYFVTRISKTN
jgi:PKD repeat protein